jgi:hypothetical protein
LIKLAIGIAYALAVFSIMIRAGDPNSFFWWLGMMPFFGWCLLPIGLALLYPTRFLPLVIIVAAIAAYSVFVYERDMFGPGVRSTSALIFIWLPVYQWGAVLALFGVDRLLQRMTK